MIENTVEQYMEEERMYQEKICTKPYLQAQENRQGETQFLLYNGEYGRNFAALSVNNLPDQGKGVRILEDSEYRRPCKREGSYWSTVYS